MLQKRTHIFKFDSRYEQRLKFDHNFSFSQENSAEVCLLSEYRINRQKPENYL